MNKRFHNLKTQSAALSPLFRWVILLLVIATGIAWLAPNVKSQEQTPQFTPTPVTEALAAHVYLPIINGQTVVEAAAVDAPVIPAEQAEAGLIYAGLEVDKSGGCKGKLLRVSKTSQCSHGPDRAPVGVNVKKAQTPLLVDQAVSVVVGACDGDGTSGNRVHVLYVRATDQADRYSAVLNSIRQWATDADNIYYESAVETGGTRRIRFVHDANCVIMVDHVVIAASADDSFSATITALEAQGYNRSDRKYMIFADASVYCGIGGLWGDDQPGQANSNNFGPSYGRTDSGCWGGHTAAHELNHNLGGVQLTAPHTSGGYHCVDENDVMCYSDSPNYPPMQNICTNPSQEDRLDCNHDDYYHTNPPTGSYLATYWNTANNQFLINANLPTPTPTLTPTATPAPPPGCTYYASSDVPKTIVDLATVESTLMVAGNFTLNDVNVRSLKIVHTYAGDLRAVLVSPAGTQVELFNGVGGSGANFTDTFFDDTATTLISAGTAPFTGVYRSASVLSALNGQNSIGVWRLRITDQVNNDSGVLNGWGLQLCGSSAPTPTPTFTPTPTPTVVNDLIFKDGFESGNLASWSASTTDSGDLSATSAAKLVGNYGLAANIDDNNVIYVTNDSPNSETRYRVRFAFDPNSASMTSGNAYYLFYGYQGTSTVVLRLELRFSSGAYQLRAALRNDSSTWTASSWFTVSDAPHQVEIDWQKSTATGANNGRLTFWIDSVQKAALTGMDNDTRRIDRVRLGAVASIDSGTRGISYFDAFESRRQTLIGPASNTITTPHVDSENAVSAAAVDETISLVIAAVQADRAGVWLGESDGLKIQTQLPANAISEAATLLVTASDNHTLPDGYTLLGRMVAVQLRTASGATVAAYAQPLTLTLDYQQVANSDSDARLSLQAWNAESNAWETLSAEVDPATGTVTTLLSQPTLLALLQQEGSTPEVEEAEQKNHSQDEAAAGYSIYLPALQR